MLPIIFFNSLIFIKHEINTKFYTDKTRFFIAKIYNKNYLCNFQLLKDQQSEIKNLYKE